MPHLIHQKVTLPAAPATLFNIYLDSRKRGAAIDGRVSISQTVGARFTAFNGWLRGRNLVIVPSRMIVQSWRATSWGKGDPDSILTLLFSKAGRGG